MFGYKEKEGREIKTRGAHTCFYSLQSCEEREENHTFYYCSINALVKLLQACNMVKDKKEIVGAPLYFNK